MPSAEDNLLPGDFIFSKLLNQLRETMPNYAELVFHMFKMSSTVDYRGSKLIRLPLNTIGSAVFVWA